MKLSTMIPAMAAALFLGAAVSSWADHGALETRVRDAWINDRVDDLTASGLVDAGGRAAKDMTNLQVAQLTADAAQKLTDPPSVPATTPAAQKSLADLTAEFKDELAAMGVDLAKLENRLTEARQRNKKFTALAKQALQKTGTQISGSAKAYSARYAGYGTDAFYPASGWNNIIYVDMRLRSVPVPSVLFDLHLRATRTFGQYYVDPLATNAKANVRWIALTCAGKSGSFTTGDFWRSYTPLTLWNYDIPVYTLLEPTSFTRTRKSLEEWVYMDHGNDWRLRGVEGATDQSWDGTAPFHSFKGQVMGGMLKDPSGTQYSQEYGGTQEALGFFQDKLNLKAAGILQQDDPHTSAMAYDPTDIDTYLRRHEVGSLSADGVLSLPSNLKADGSWEYARSRYQDDTVQADNLIGDWAILADGGVQKGDFRLTAKYLNIGPKFYSPGAQTNRYTPVTTTAGYLSTNQSLEDGLEGYRNDYVFQGLGRPAFAPYDRLAENILPYGDSTPNRQGFIFGGSAKLGKDGWIKPQVSLDLKMKEIQPDYVYTGVENYMLPVDSQTSTAVARTFQAYEGALTLDLSKLASRLPSTCALSGDYKHQSTDLGLGTDPFKVDTMIVSADAGPFHRVPLLGAVILSAAYEHIRSSGSEYVLTGQGDPPTTASYSSVLDTGSMGAYQYQAMNLKRTTWAFGFKVPVTSTFRITFDWLTRKYVWLDRPAFDCREQIWKMTHELTF